MSNRLLSQFTYNTEREIRNLELLKLRFGEASLQQCEVMLKDISDSKRINNAITGTILSLLISSKLRRLRVANQIRQSDSNLDSVIVI